MPNAPTFHQPPKITPREGNRDYRRWYNLAIWRGPNGLRVQQLARQPLCEDCLARGVTVSATDVDHRTPHRGVWELFVALWNLCSLCHVCHSLKTGRGL